MTEEPTGGARRPPQDGRPPVPATPPSGYPPGGPQGPGARGPAGVGQPGHPPGHPGHPGGYPGHLGGYGPPGQVPPGPGYPPAGPYAPGAWRPAGYGYPGYPAGGPAPSHPAVPPWQPARVEAVPGTPFGVAYPLLPPMVAGLAVGSLIAGIGAVLVALIVVCSGAFGHSGPGPLAVGAFAVLAVLAGAGAVVTGVVAVRQSGRRPGELSGRRLAIAGTACGAAAVALTAVGLVLAVTLA